MEKISKPLLVIVFLLIAIFSRTAIAFPINISDGKPLPSTAYIGDRATEGYYILTGNKPGQWVEFHNKFPSSVEQFQVGEESCNVNGKTIIPASGQCKIWLRLTPPDRPGTITSTINACLGGSVVGCTTHKSSIKIVALNSISMSISNSSAPKGASQQFQVMGTYSDGSTKDISNQVTWNSNDSSIVTVDNTGTALALAIGTALITATYQGKTCSQNFTVTPPELIELQITPGFTSTSEGNPANFTVNGKYSDGSTEELNNEVIWKSSDPSKAESVGGGKIKTNKEGQVTITAEFENKSAAATLKIDPPQLLKISISLEKANFLKGKTLQLKALGQYTNGSQDITNQVVWSAQPNNIVTFSDITKGLITGKNIGTTSIAATLDGKTDNVEITIDPPTLEFINIAEKDNKSSIPKGITAQFIATGNYSDGHKEDISDKVDWTSSSSEILSFSNTTKGLANTINTGKVTINATLDGKTRQISLTVTAAELQEITIESLKTNIPKGKTNQFKAYGKYTDNPKKDITDQIKWSSSSKTILNFSDTIKGLATGINTGSVKVNASLDGKIGSFNFTINPAELLSVTVITDKPKIAKGETSQFEAYAKYTDTPEGNRGTDITNNKSVVWNSSNSAVATIDTYGLAITSKTSIKGTTNISATFNGKFGQASLKVNPAELKELIIQPKNPTISKGIYQQFTAKGIYTDGTENSNMTNDVEWISTNTSRAAFDNSEKAGEIHALENGKTTITAQKNGVTSNTQTLTIKTPQLTKIEITTPSSSIAKGTSLEFLAKGFYTDGSTKDNIAAELEWSSDSTAAVFKGKTAYGAKEGEAIITATQGKIQSTNSVKLTIIPHQLVKIKVTPESATTYIGDTQQFTAKAIYTDTDPKTDGDDITSRVSWQSTNTIAATISNEQATKGLATAVSLGETDITAEFNPTQNSILTGTTHLTINNHSPIINRLTPTEVARDTNPLLLDRTDNSLKQKTSKELTISGQYFLDGAKVELHRKGKVISTSNIVVSKNARSISCHIEIPNKTEVGKWDVIITNPDNQTATLKEAIEIKYPAPTAEFISPNQGLNDESKIVTITGSDFIEKETSVTFGDKTATNVNVAKNGSSLTAKTPITEFKGEVDVIIKTPGGESNSLKFTFQARPKVTNIQPNFGWQNGGTVVTITGENFTKKSTIKFGKNKTLHPITVNEPLNEITAIAPPGTNSVHVTITTETGTSKENSGDIFYYDIPFSKMEITSPLTISYNPTIYDISANQSSVFALNGSDLFIYDKQKNIWSKHHQADLANQHLTSVCTTKRSAYNPSKTYISSFEGNLYELKHDKDITSKYRLHQLNSGNPKMYGNTNLYCDNNKIYMSGLFGIFGQDNAIGIYDKNTYETSKFEYKTYRLLQLSYGDITRSIIADDDDEIQIATNKYLSSLHFGNYLFGDASSSVYNIFKDTGYYYASTSQGLFFKYKNSNAWKKLSQLFDNLPEYLTKGLVYDFVKIGLIKIVATDIGLYINEDQDWKLHRVDKNFIYEGLISNNIFKVFIDNNNTETVYALTDKGLSYTTDFGENWHLSNLRMLSAVTDAKQIDINKNGILAVTSPKDGIVVYDTEAIKYTQLDGTVIAPFYRSRAFNTSTYHLPSTQIDKIKMMAKNYQIFAIAYDQQTKTSILINRKVKRTAGEKVVDQEGNDITNKSVDVWSYLSNKKDKQFKNVKFLDILEDTKAETLYLLTENLSQDNSTNKKGLKIFISENSGNTWNLEREFEKNSNLSKTITIGKTNILVTDNEIYIILEPPKNNRNYIGITYDLNNKPYLIDNYGNVYTYIDSQKSYTKMTAYIALGKIKNLYPVKNSETASALITTAHGMFVGEVTKNIRDNTTIWVWNKLDVFHTELKIKNIASCVYLNKLNQRKMKIYAVDEKGLLHEAVYDL